jgi:histidinol dehydrogenase
VQCELIVVGDEDPRALAAGLRALVPGGAAVSEPVAEIIARVREQGDAAVLDYTRRFDTAGADPAPLRVADEELDHALDRLDPAVHAGLGRAIANVQRVAEAGLTDDRRVAFDDGHAITLRAAPVDSAGVYVPGGRAPYPSTVVMGVVTARTAGVPAVVVTAPPGPGGEIDHVVLAACRLTGASAVYRMGGAQAVAALAYGTESVAAVDVIVGPGNLYVQEAKRQVFGQVGIDGFAGPSDLMVIAEPEPEEEADAEAIALDLLAQAEHGPGTLVIGVSTSAELLAALQERISAGPDTGAIARLVRTQTTSQALALARAFAPEHLELIGAEAEALAPEATRAGCLFVGPNGATAFGDYIAGSNHVLPTDGAARFASTLSTAHFRRRFTEVRIDDAAAGELAALAAPVARAEGFELHAQSMEARVRDNGPHDPLGRDRSTDR